MSKFKQGVLRLIQRALVYLVEEISLFRYVGFFVSAVLIFGIIYKVLTPHGHGIGRDLVPLSDPTFLGGIYFSIVTVSSLGYGDMHPMGLSKALACVEVLMGLTVMGIMIAKVTSQRLSHHVSRLFSSDAQERLEKMTANFETSHTTLNRITRELANAYQQTPGGGPNGGTKSVLSNFRNAMITLHSNCMSFRDYLVDETTQGNYFQIAPVNAVVRAGEAVDKVFFRLGQLIINLSQQAKTDLLDGQNRRRISEAIGSQKEICTLVSQYVTDTEIQKVFQCIEETCQNVPASYFAVPKESQPDQVLQDTDEPSIVGIDDEETTSP
ncbi:MAG: potassium channel family protein [Nitrospira sp.]|nr:potassium channel family protein [Nitrospira sp.]